MELIDHCKRDRKKANKIAILLLFFLFKSMSQDGGGAETHVRQEAISSFRREYKYCFESPISIVSCMNQSVLYQKTHTE